MIQIRDAHPRQSSVRFIPENGHAQHRHQCPLSAISGHSPIVGYMLWAWRNTSSGSWRDLMS